MAARRCFPREVVVAIKALACELPGRLGAPLSRLHVPDITAEVVRQGIVAEISSTTVWRWLSEAQPGIEIFFSVVQRKVLTPNDFADLADVEARLAAFERRYEQPARPFEWSFTRDDLALLIKKLARKADYQDAA